MNGTRGVEQQIIKKSLQLLTFKVECSEVNLSAAAEKLCNSLFSASTFVNSDDVLYFDKSKSYSGISNNFTYNKCAYNITFTHQLILIEAKFTMIPMSNC